jgi:hypothetical protein
MATANDSLESKIRGMAASSNPTAEQIAMVMSEWEWVFSALGITDERGKLEEFDGVMRARVRSGIVSIRAPIKPCPACESIERPYSCARCKGKGVIVVK